MIHPLFSDWPMWHGFSQHLPDIPVTFPQHCTSITRDNMRIFPLKSGLIFSSVQSLSCVRVFETPWTLGVLPDSCIHGIFQARVLQWVAISFSRESSWPRDWTQVSCIIGKCFYPLSHRLPYNLIYILWWSFCIYMFWINQKLKIKVLLKYEVIFRILTRHFVKIY